MSALIDCCVLIVEDEFYLAKDLQETLKAAGARLLGPFPGNAEARAALADETPAVAVLDVNLGQGPDFSLADELRGRGVPVIFFTGYDPEVIPARFTDLPRLEKPVDSSRLVRAAEAACKAARPNMD